MSGLSDYLNSLNRDGWSLRRIAKEAENHGHSINYTTVRHYINGTHGTPSGEALAALAAAFRVDVNQLRAAADRPSVGEPFELGPETARLTGPQREAIRHVVRVMLNQNDGVVADPTVDDGATTTRNDLGLAASHGRSRLAAMDEAADAAGEESQDPEDWT